MAPFAVNHKNSGFSYLYETSEFHILIFKMNPELRKRVGFCPFDVVDIF